MDKVTVNPGDFFTILRDNKKIEVQAINSHDRGATWLCSRTDGPPSETAFVVPVAELLESARQDPK